MIVVLDSNIWIEELALNSGAGSALRFFLRQQEARLAVPEVVRLETQRHIGGDIKKAIEQVAEGHRKLLAIFGSLREVALPTEAQVAAVTGGIFDRLGVEVIDVPFSLDSARSAFLKTIEKVPPSDKSQEFKDSVLWADCVRLLDQDDVLLATQDKAFFSGRQYKAGLAPNLRQEIAGKPHRLTLVGSTRDLLQHVASTVAVDEEWLAGAIQEAHASLDTLLSRVGAAIAGPPEIAYELFATEHADRLYLTYEVQMECVDTGGTARTDMRLLLKGSGVYRPTMRELSDLRPDEERLTYKDPDGTEGRSSNVFASAHGVIGHRTITHTIRHPLGGGAC